MSGWGENSKFQPVTQDYRDNMDRINMLKVVNRSMVWLRKGDDFHHLIHGVKTLKQAYEIQKVANNDSSK